MKMRELLSDESKWCKHRLARDRDGNGVMPHASTACQWCLLGALDACYPMETKANTEVYNMILSHLISRGFNSYIPSFNDNTDFETIRKLLEELDI